MELQDVEFDEIDETKKNKENAYQAFCEEDDKPVRKKRGGKGILIASVVLFLLSATILSVVVLCMVSGDKIKDLLKKNEPVDPEPVEVTYTQTQVDQMLSDAVNETYEKTVTSVREEMTGTLRDASEKESGVLMLLREYFPNEVTFINGSKYEFYPIYSELKPNTIVNENLYKDEETGYISYSEDGNEVTSHLCIDVSSFQGNINWNSVKNAGVDYVFIRCAIRGYGSGKIVEDSAFKTNVEGALKAGLKVGVYFFTAAVSPEEAQEEAAFVLDLIAPYKIELPIVYDIEEIQDKARTDDLTNEQRTDNVIAFCDTVRDAGYVPMIYSNLRFFIKQLEIQRLGDYEKWYALYNDSIYFPYEIAVWQYSNNGKVEGINTGVDLNVMFKEW